MSEFGVGDRVTWTSQAGGHSKTKTGVIIAHVSAGRWAWDVVSQGGWYWGYRYRKYFGLTSRKHHSYLVAVPDRYVKNKPIPTLYWPRVSALRKADKDA